MELPFAFAFTAGLVATLNPCGFAMLPAYLATCMGLDEDTAPTTTGASVRRAVQVGAVVSAGFLLVFGLAGILITLGVRAMVDALPWIAMVVAGTIPQLGFVAGVATFLVYGLGMSTLLLVTLALAFGKHALVTRLRTASQHVNHVAGAILILAGAYIVFFWATTLAGDGLTRRAGPRPADPASHHRTSPPVTPPTEVPAMRRAPLLLTGLALIAAACAAPTATDGAPPDDAPDDAAQADSGSDPGTDATATADVEVRTQSVGCEEGEFFWQVDGCEPATSIDLDRLRAGGPPPDGIPPIDDPVYESIEAADEWLEDESPVMVVDVNDDVRAYPLAILTWHEIVNDVVGDVPLVVTYCPLCNSALVFERTLDTPDGQVELDFGTSGRLYQSNLVMYDRQSRNLWTQFEGEGIIGERFLGAELTRVPAWLFGFAELRELHPDAQVLSRDTGHNRDYGRNPYTAYDQEGRAPFLFDGELDDRFSAMARMVGLAEGDDAVAVFLDQLTEERTVEVTVGAREIVVLWAPGQASALDAAVIDDGRDVGQTAAFVAELDGEPVDLTPTDTDGRFVDERSGSTFDLRGRALDGSLEGQQLEAVTHDDTFWFVWVAFKPDSEVVGG